MPLFVDIQIKRELDRGSLRNAPLVIASILVEWIFGCGIGRAWHSCEQHTQLRIFLLERWMFDRRGSCV